MKPAGVHMHAGNAATSLLLLLTCITALAIPCSASRILTDETGSRVVAPDHPHRIVCLAPSVADTVFALGAGDDVVAISDYTKYPAEATRKPSIGGIGDPSIEKIFALHPDLVIGIATMGPSASTERLEHFNIPVFLTNPHGISGILRSVESVGRALDRTPQATVLVTNLQRRIDAVKTRTKNLPAPAVFMPIWYDPIITPGKHAFITQIIETAGGRSVTDDLPTEWPQISMEALLVRAPNALLLVRGGKTTLDVLKNRPGWSSLPALQAHRVYYVDDRIDFPSPVAIDALEDLARQFHP